jgi:prevent-host-death family protein
MKDIGIRELKKRASALVRQLAESREPYTITRRGKAVAVLSPFREDAEKEHPGPEAWNRFEQLADRLGRHPSRSAVKELSRMRR